MKNLIRKILTTNLDNKINEIKNNIVQAEKLKNDAQQTLSEIKKGQNDISKEIDLGFQQLLLKTMPPLLPLIN